MTLLRSVMMDQVSGITHLYSVSIVVALSKRGSVLMQGAECDVCIIALHPSLTASQAFSENVYDACLRPGINSKLGPHCCVLSGFGMNTRQLVVPFF